MVFGASDHHILIVPRMVHGQTHNRSLVAGEFPSGCKPREMIDCGQYIVNFYLVYRYKQMMKPKWLTFVDPTL